MAAVLSYPRNRIDLNGQNVAERRGLLQLKHKSLLSCVLLYFAAWRVIVPLSVVFAETTKKGPGIESSSIGSQL